jgi:hypothetical protein
MKAEGLVVRPALDQTAVASAPFHAWTCPDGTPWTQFHRMNGGYLLRFPDLADFEIAADASVSCVPVPGISEDTLQHLYLNQVLPLILSKLGRLVFHASAVVTDGRAMAFMGESGRGKSTLAASFSMSGSQFLTDDGLVVEADAAGFQALPSHPSIRLWEDSEAALLPPTTRRAPPLHYTSKARFLADADLGFCNGARPLRRVYFLGDGSANGVTIEPLGAARTLMELVKNSFLLDVEEQSRLSSHFAQVAALANRPIHYRLDYPRRFERLTAVRKAILDHVHQEGDAV